MGKMRVTEYQGISRAREAMQAPYGALYTQDVDATTTSVQSKPVGPDARLVIIQTENGAVMCYRVGKNPTATTSDPWVGGEHGPATVGVSPGDVIAGIEAA